MSLSVPVPGRGYILCALHRYRRSCDTGIPILSVDANVADIRCIHWSFSKSYPVYSVVLVCWLFVYWPCCTSVIVCLSNNIIIPVTSASSDIDVDVEEFRAQTIVSMPVLDIQFMLIIN